MTSRDTDHTRIKAFHKMMVEILGNEVWAQRKKVLIEQIRKKEQKIDLRLPIEQQLYIPPLNDIDWYILVAELAYDSPMSDSHYSSTRIYPYTMAIGAMSEQILAIPNVQGVIDKMLRNKSQPENQLFELLTASFYIRNGFEVAFIPENSIVWPDGKTKKSPDMLVRRDGIELYVECKRAGKQTTYSQEEEGAWNRLWEQLSKYVLSVSPWSVIEIVFHSQVASITIEELIRSVDLAVEKKQGKINTGRLTIEIKKIDKFRMNRHYENDSVRPNSSQQEILVFGNCDSNEKRNIATIAKSIVRAGSSSSFLNIFIEEVSACVGVQWRCDHDISLERRSRHFKGLAHDAVIQIPPDKPGIVHILYETVEGIKIEELRAEKNFDNISNYDGTGTSVLGVLLHAVNYYPSIPRYEWAETVQNFSRVPGIMSLFRHSLMLALDKGNEYDSVTHWQQDKDRKPN